MKEKFDKGKYDRKENWKTKRKNRTNEIRLKNQRANQENRKEETIF